MLPYLQVRNMGVSDVPPVSHLVAEVFDAPQYRDFFSARFGCPLPQVVASMGLIAHQHNTIAGFVLWAYDEFLSVITAIGVAQTHRRFGVASLLVSTAIDVLRADGSRVVDVVCDQTFVPCLQLLQKQKFRVWQHDDSYMVLTRRLVGGRNRGDGFDA